MNVDVNFLDLFFYCEIIQFNPLCFVLSIITALDITNDLQQCVNNVCVDAVLMFSGLDGVVMSILIPAFVVRRSLK